jgi:hypothetical protein
VLKSTAVARFKLHRGLTVKCSEVGNKNIPLSVGYHNQIELTFAIKDTNKESIINDGGNRIATKMAVGK